MTIYNVTLENKKGDINTRGYMVETRREAAIEATKDLGENKEEYYIIDISAQINKTKYEKTYNILLEEEEW